MQLTWLKLIRSCSFLLGFMAPLAALAGGSGLNVVVVANQSSSNSLELANYYCEKRGVPSDNVLYINWTGTNTLWNISDFQTVLFGALTNMLAGRQLTNQIDYVVLSMDIPFQTADGSTINSTTSGLFYGLKTNTGLANSYAASESVFRQTPPNSAPGSSFLTTMITADTLAQAEQLVDQGVASDGGFPQQPVVLAKSSDTSRNLRYTAFDNAIFNVDLLGVSSIFRTNTDSLAGLTGFLGYETGLANYSLAPGTFVPGAIADSMTSYGGVIFGPNGQTSLLTCIYAGAAGSYGTVSEPNGDTQKFPDPQVYFYQARGFSLAESYYQSVNSPFLGLTVAEPLAAPFLRPFSGKWLSTNAFLTGTSNRLGAAFSATDAAHPLQQIDLFVDGKYFNTLTSLSPRPGNVLNVNFNGYPVAYIIPTNATVSSVVAGLVAALNGSATNYTQATAIAHGDRIELHSDYQSFTSAPFYVLHYPGTNPSLYYDVSYLPYPVPPQLTGLGKSNGNYTVRVDTPDPMPYVLYSSTNLGAPWVPIFTNAAGGTLVFPDQNSTNHRSQFYSVIGSPGPPPSLQAPIYSVSAGPNGSDLLQINWAGRPYVVTVSPDLMNWTPIFTNLAPGVYQVSASSSIGGGDSLTMSLSASSSMFLDSQAVGRQQYIVTKSTISAGAYLQFTFTKTNGLVVSVGVTNQVSGAISTNLVAQVYALINSNPALQGSDGVVAQDFLINGAGTVYFNLLPRSPGWEAAQIEVTSLHSGIFILPSSQGTLTSNLGDLQPRDHLYVAVGTTYLSVRFPFDSTQLTDGYHQLVAVAYDGTSVRGQCRATTSVNVQNTSLTATLTPLDFGTNASVQGTYHVQVAANTSNIASISLYTTGGVLNTISNQQSATFVVNGPSLGAGLHPFYALVQSSSGLKYRTQTYSARFVH
jgi:uncharacterized protein (TIGR03790 family)